MHFLTRLFGHIAVGELGNFSQVIFQFRVQERFSKNSRRRATNNSNIYIGIGSSVICLWVTNRVGNFDLRGVLSFHFCRSSCPLVASTRSTHSRWKLIHQPCQSSGHKAVTTNIWTRLRSPNCAVRHALSCCTTKTTLNELDEDRLGSILKPFFIGQQWCLSTPSLSNSKV